MIYSYQSIVKRSLDVKLSFYRLILYGYHADKLKKIRIKFNNV